MELVDGPSTGTGAVARAGTGAGAGTGGAACAGTRGAACAGTGGAACAGTGANAGGAGSVTGTPGRLHICRGSGWIGWEVKWVIGWLF